MKNNLNGLLSGFRDARSGSVLVLVAVSFGVMLSAVLLSTEISNYSSTKSRFVTAVDEAVLAAAASNAADPLPYATEYLRTNLNLKEDPNNNKSLGNNKLTVTRFSVTPNADRTKWTASAKATLNTNFAKLIGIKRLTMTHTASVEWNKNSRSEIVTMVDVAGFACTRVKSTAQQNNTFTVNFSADKECTKLDFMHKAIKNIATIGIGYSGDASSGQVVDPIYKVGIVPFSYKVKIPTTTNLPAFLTDGEKSEKFDGPAYYQSTADAENGVPLPKIMPLTWIRNQLDKDAYLAKIDALFTSDNKEFNRPFMVRPALGALASAMLLDPDYYANFGGVRPVPFGTANNKKIIVMATDAAHLGCCYTNWPAGNFDNNYVYSYKADEEFMRDASGNGLCKNMKEQGIEVFTILFDVDSKAPGAENITKTFDACATDEAHAFHVAYGDEDTLKKVYTLVGKALMNLKLSR